MNKLQNKIRLAIIPLMLAPLLCAGANQISVTSESADFENRCGWFANPTPGNIWLYDRDDEWTIGVQGGHQVEKDWDWPVFKPGQWVKTNNTYGYGCACLELKVDKETKDVTEIKTARARPLTACRQDAALKKWNKQFK